MCFRGSNSYTCDEMEWYISSGCCLFPRLLACNTKGLNVQTSKTLSNRFHSSFVLSFVHNCALFPVLGWCPHLLIYPDGPSWYIGKCQLIYWGRKRLAIWSEIEVQFWITKEPHGITDRGNSTFIAVMGKHGVGEHGGGGAWGWGGAWSGGAWGWGSMRVGEHGVGEHGGLHFSAVAAVLRK